MGLAPRVASVLLLYLPLFPPAVAQAIDTAPPGWASALRLSSHGGPVSGDVEVLLNGEFVAEFGEGEPPFFQEIEDLVVAGENRLEVRIRPPASPRAGSDHLRIAVIPVSVSGTRITQSGHPLVELTVPRYADGGEPCTESSPFWAGPEPTADPSVKGSYWVFATGPPARVRVTTFINGRPVHDGSAGDEWIEVTRFVRKGKNEVRFESRPTCLVVPSGRGGLFEVAVGPAEVIEDMVRQTAPPDAAFEVDPRRTVRPETVRRTLRAR